MTAQLTSPSHPDKPRNRTALVFASTSLNRTVDATAIMQLSNKELRTLHAELLFAMQGLDEAVGECLAADTCYTKNWLHRVKTKRRICKTFLEHVKLQMAVLTDSATTFKNVFAVCFARVVAEEVGATVYQELVDEATREARTIVDDAPLPI